MSFLDKIAGAVMPLASDEDRAEARNKVRSLARGDDWLGQVVAHHEAIEFAFDQALNASGGDARKTALKQLGVLLTGHSNAEEAVLYPAIVDYSGKHHATMAYEEQAMAKIEMAELEKLDPMGTEWREKLEHIQGAVAQHVYQEENEWFPDVIEKAPAEVQQMLTARYGEEYNRYADGDPSAQKATAHAF